MIGHHTEKRREDQFAHPESLWAVEMMLQPVAVIAMGAKSPSGDAEVIRAPLSLNPPRSHQLILESGC